MQLICLANSPRPDGRCIAGLDRESGDWVRPVPRRGDAIPEFRCIIDGKELSLLDVVELSLVQSGEIAKYQRENRIIKDWNLAVVGRGRKSSLIAHLEHSTPVLYTSNDRVSPSLLEKLPPTEWKSLQLVQPIDLHFVRDRVTAHRWRAKFRDLAGNAYSLTVTDPKATRRLELGETIKQNSLLTVSLTKPWCPDPTSSAYCYKLVAAVIEL